MRAVSFAVRRQDAEDALLYASVGGLQLLQQMKGLPKLLWPALVAQQLQAAQKLADLAPAELFKDPSREQPAVHLHPSMAEREALGV
jgi:hypothetical protein